MKYNITMNQNLQYGITRVQNLYLIPPTIFSHESVNTMDVLFLKYSQAPLVSPLQKSMKI